VCFTGNSAPRNSLTPAAQHEPSLDPPSNLQLWVPLASLMVNGTRVLFRLLKAPRKIPTIGIKIQEIFWMKKSNVNHGLYKIRMKKPKLDENIIKIG
jgi:hypothetical protein